ncbi:DUF1918 domain-containing protein [Cellulomonas sp. P5_C5]
MERIVRARAGDRLVVAGAHLGDTGRDAEVVEVRGDDDGPPFLVRWSDSGHLGLVFPGPDAVIAAAHPWRSDVRRRATDAKPPLSTFRTSARPGTAALG